jgi:hypothetical protein
MAAVFARSAAVLALFAVAVSGAGPSQPPIPAPDRVPTIAPAPPARSPRNANYTIAAALTPRLRIITGEQTLDWRNISPVPASSLQFHLYYNAWRNARSSWMRERGLGGDASLASRPEADWGWIDVTSLAIRGASGDTDVTGRMRFIAPDDHNPDDRTVMELPLDRPVAPGDSIVVRMTWTSHVPRTFARTGAIDDVFFIAQWFPKIGVLEESGWNTHQFHSPTEFYSDFGVYDVQLTVPHGWLLGATGVERDRREGPDGTTTHHYFAEDVHDFAWTTSPDYVEHIATFQHATLPPVRMRLLLQPEHAGQEQRHFDATRAALRYYGEWFGPYPYSHITVVDPAWQSGAGGMEYPTLFTAGARWIAPRGVTQPESVTVHEAGHQFWYGVVATNEFEHAWMDEGLNTFSTARVIDQVGWPNYYAKRFFGGFIPWVFSDLRLERATDGNRLHPFRAAAHGDPQSNPTWTYWPGHASAISYNKTALWLGTLERMLGWDTLQRILSTYYARWAFKHPKPTDFFAIANEVSGRDLTWFFDEVYRSSKTFDYGVAAFRSEPATSRGFFGEGRDTSFVDRVSGPPFRTTVVARRHGDGVFPVDVRITFENGEEARYTWNGVERWKVFEVDTAVRARTAQVDPERVLLLDLNYTNNSASLSPSGPRAARKWSLTWLIWLQDHLLTYGFFI